MVDDNVRKGVWQVPGEREAGGGVNKNREAARKRALGMESGVSEKHAPCIGSEVKDSSDTFSPVNG